MSRKKETIVVLCLLVVPILLERFGIISGNWLQDARDLVLAITAVAAVGAMLGTDDLKAELKRMKSLT